MALTRYKAGSVGELATIALPLILSSTCTMAMIFVDRLLLAQFSTEAMNAAANAATAGWAFVMFVIALAGIAEAFVAQNNGAERYREVAVPVWQMMWLSLSSLVVFLPLSLWSAPFLFSGSPYYRMEVDYYEILMLLGPVTGMVAALTAFWVGRGKATLITGLSIFANLVNCVLDYLLIFGVEGWFSAMGTRGAIIGTFVAESSLAIVLFCLLLRTKNREKYGTGDCSVNFPMIMRCVRVGFPSALFIFIEIAGWGVFYRQMTRIGHEYITIAAVAQSLCIFLWGLGEGLQKTMVTIAGNRIGEGRPEVAMKSLRTSMWLVAIWHMAALVLLLFYVDNVWGWFVDIQQFSNPETIVHTLRWVIALTVIYTMVETFRFAIGGVLTAAGDTLFLMLVGVVTMWGLLVLPVELFVVRPEASILVAFGLWVFYSVVGCGINWFRLVGGSWQKRSLLQREAAV
jgi:MATE family multidrug resistance protein